MEHKGSRASLWTGTRHIRKQSLQPCLLGKGTCQASDPDACSQHGYLGDSSFDTYVIDPRVNPNLNVWTISFPGIV